MHASDFFFPAPVPSSTPASQQRAEDGLSQSSNGRLDGEGLTAAPETRGCPASDGQSDRCLVLGPSSSGLSSVLLSLACRLAAAHPHRPVIFIARTGALDAHPPLLPASLSPSSPLLHQIYMRYVQSTEELRQFAAAVHLAASPQPHPSPSHPPPSPSPAPSPPSAPAPSPEAAAAPSAATAASPTARATPQSPRAACASVVPPLPCAILVHDLTSLLRPDLTAKQREMEAVRSVALLADAAAFLSQAGTTSNTSSIDPASHTSSHSPTSSDTAPATAVGAPATAAVTGCTLVVSECFPDAALDPDVFLPVTSPLPAALSVALPPRAAAVVARFHHLLRWLPQTFLSLPTAHPCQFRMLPLKLTSSLHPHHLSHHQHEQTLMDRGFSLLREESVLYGLETMLMLV